MSPGNKTPPATAVFKHRKLNTRACLSVFLPEKNSPGMPFRVAAGKEFPPVYYVPHFTFRLSGAVSTTAWSFGGAWSPCCRGHGSRHVDRAHQESTHRRASQPHLHAHRELHSPPRHATSRAPPLASGRMWLDPGVACGQLGVAVAAIPPTGHGHGALLVWWLCIESSVLGTPHRRLDQQGHPPSPPGACGPV